jgi:hypothetical protein
MVSKAFIFAFAFCFFGNNAEAMSGEYSVEVISVAEDGAVKIKVSDSVPEITAEAVDAFFRGEGKYAAIILISMFLAVGVWAITDAIGDNFLFVLFPGRMNIYIVGEIKGNINYEKEFNEAERRLREAGFDNVVNPARLYDKNKKTLWNNFDAAKVRMANCNAVATFSYWNIDNKELSVAYSLNMRRNQIDDWVNSTWVRRKLKTIIKMIFRKENIKKSEAL